MTLCTSRILRVDKALTFTSVMSLLLQNKETCALKTGDPEPAPPAAGLPRLYSHRFCPFSQRIQIYLVKKGIRAELVNVNMVEKPEWYWSKNPQGSVPAFELNGKIVYESPIVNEFLDNLFPATSILPSDPYERALQQIIAERLNVILVSWKGIFAALKGALKGEKSDADVREEIRKFISVLDECEKLKDESKPFFAGSTPGFPDYIAFPICDRLWAMLTGTLPAVRPSLADDVKLFTATDFPGSAKWPRLTRWFDAMGKLGEVVASRQSHEAQVEFLKGYVVGKPNYDIGIPHN